MKQIEMLYSDVSFGTQEYGFIPRGKKNRNAEDACDSEDLRYARHLRSQGIDARVANGYVTLFVNGWDNNA